MSALHPGLASLGGELSEVTVALKLATCRAWEAVEAKRRGEAQKPSGLLMGL